MKNLLLVKAAIAVISALEVAGPPIARAAPGDLYVSQTAEGTIVKFSPDGTMSAFLSGLDHPGALAFDRTGNLFVSIGPGRFRDIDKISPEGEITVFATEISLLSGLAFDGAGNLYVSYSTGDTGAIFRFSPDGTKTNFGSYHSPLVSGSPFGLAFSPLGDLYATVSPNPFDFDGGVIRYTPDGTGGVFALASGPGLAFDTAGNLHIGLDDQILRFAPLAAGNPTVFASGFQAPSALAFDPEGNLFVADRPSDVTSSIQKVTSMERRPLLPRD